jgi:hypothetical protein
MTQLHRCTHLNTSASVNVVAVIGWRSHWLDQTPVQFYGSLTAALYRLINTLNRLFTTSVIAVGMADPAVGWVPLAGLLEAASNELEVGQMLHTSVFSLFEAMSAVEIGNPKMDAGKQGPQGTPSPAAVPMAALAALHSSCGSLVTVKAEHVLQHVTTLLKFHLPSLHTSCTIKSGTTNQ